MKIFVGSLNPVKINAVTLAASESWPNVEVYGLDVPSGISDQPMSDEETRKGAVARARAALRDGLQRSKKTSDPPNRTDLKGDFKKSIVLDEFVYFDHANDPSQDARADQTSNSELILGVGLEGGVFEEENGELWSTVWATVIDKEGRLFESNGARFKVPTSIATKILSGGEMGPIVSKMFDGADIKRQQGAIGVITNHFVDRTEEYSMIVKLALGLWYGRDWEKQLRTKFLDK